MPPSRSVISVVDDDVSVRKAVRRLIRSVGLDAETYPSAEDFLESLAIIVPRCLIVDVRMGGMSGLELQPRLIAAGWRIPIVFITAHEDEQVRQAALDAGAVAFLLKPFEDHHLLDAVARALRQGPEKVEKPDVSAESIQGVPP